MSGTPMQVPLLDLKPQYQALKSAIDAAIRHQLTLRGITTGQRVPEDWDTAVASKLVRTSMQSAGMSAYDPKACDLGFFFSQATTQGTAKGRLDA